MTVTAARHFPSAPSYRTCSVRSPVGLIWMCGGCASPGCYHINIATFGSDPDGTFPLYLTQRKLDRSDHPHRVRAERDIKEYPTQE